MVSNEKWKVFVIEDNKLYLQLLLDYFKRNPKLEFTAFSSGKDCIDQLVLQPDIIIIDYFLESKYQDTGKNSLDVLQKITELDPTIPIIVLSAKENIQIAVDSLQYGAYDYVVKNENAFMRLENAIMNIIRGNMLKKIVRDYKT